MAEAKITKKMKYERIMAILNGEPIIAEDKDMLLEFCEHEIELLANKKSNKKLTPAQIENLRIADIVLNILTACGSPLTIQEICAEHDDLNGRSPQYMNAILNILIDKGQVEKTMDKKKAYFGIVAVEGA